MKASDWISVEDRLPKIGERAMACQQFNDGSTFARMATRVQINQTNRWYDDEGFELEYITHWQTIVLPNENMGKFKCYAFLCTAVNERQREYAEKYGSLTSAGYANGYVAIPKHHPLYRVSYDEVGIDVHGGLTFADYSEVVNKHFDKSKIECLDGELPDGYWVFGFDTMHFMDNLDNYPREWCIAETNRLKQQLENWEE